MYVAYFFGRFINFLLGYSTRTLLISCSDIPPEGTGAAAGPAVSSVTLLTSSSQLDSIGTESVALTALIRDVNNNLMRDVSVTFRANSGSIQVVRGTTDDTGTATAALGTGGNPANRDITVTATGGPITAQTVVNVRGTIITIDGLSTTTRGQTVELTGTLFDSSGAKDKY